MPTTDATDDPPAAPPPDAAPARKVWRRAAFARRASKVYTRGGLLQVLGGEILDDPALVPTLAGDDNFMIIEVESPEHLVYLREGYARDVARLREAAADLGLVVFRDGEVEPPRRRG
ncbi:MAG: hypothetical protein U0324_46950 [Polyangiales bacterium]